MTATRVFFPKIRALFPISEKGQGDLPLSHSSYALKLYEYGDMFKEICSRIAVSGFQNRELVKLSFDKVFHNEKSLFIYLFIYQLIHLYILIQLYIAFLSLYIYIIHLSAYHKR